jgi:hypothetical protein
MQVAIKSLTGGAVMRVRMLISPFLLFLVLGVLVVLAPMYASAACCGCSKCWMKTYTNPPCSCPGEGGCHVCLTDDSDLIQSETLVGNEMLNIKGIYDSRPSLTLRSTSIDRLITVTDLGQCARNNYTLKFFHSPEDRLKFERDFLKYKASQDNSVVAFQITANGEK